jgi:hypothetical protein
LYNYKQGDAYAYIWEKEGRDGRSTDEVTLLRYIGRENGLYIIQEADRPKVEAVCERPCKQVRVLFQGHLVDQFPFSAETAIGGGFEDAFNGLLEPASDKSLAAGATSNTSGD